MQFCYSEWQKNFKKVSRHVTHQRCTELPPAWGRRHARTTQTQISPVWFGQVLARSQTKRRSQSMCITLASRLQQSQAGLFSLKRQGSMLILSTSQRRDQGGRDCRTVSWVFHWPQNPKEPGTEAGQGLPRPQILARVLRNPIKRSTRQEEIKEKNTGWNSLCFPVYYKKSFHFPHPYFKGGKKEKKNFSSTNEQAPVPEPTPRRLECALERLNRYRHWWWSKPLTCPHTEWPASWHGNPCLVIHPDQVRSMNWKKNRQIRMNLRNQRTSLRNVPKPLYKKSCKSI